MEKIFSVKKILVFLLLMAIMVMAISIFSLYSKDKEKIEDGFLVRSSMMKS